MSLVNLFGMDEGDLGGLMSALGEPAYRARQVHAWLYRRRVREVGAMTNLGLALRRRLSATHAVRWPEVLERRDSTDGSARLLFGLGDGATAEAVFMPEGDHRTVCVSTQAGCPLACAFCLTGLGGYRRNLGPGEILGQVAAIQEAFSPPVPGPWNVVLMGMGEPLLNAEATIRALRVLMHPEGFSLPPRRVTLSTVGILPGLERLAREPVRPALAISLHAPDAHLRRRLMPIEARYPLAEVLAAARAYPSPAGAPVTYEYVLLGGVNDGPHQARELASLLGPRAKVNLIPLNPAPGIPFEVPTEEAIDDFCRTLAASGLTVSVRRSRGRDILAACGQLHLARSGPAAEHADSPGSGSRV